MLVSEMFTCKDERKHRKDKLKFGNKVQNKLTKKPGADGFSYDHSGTATGERGIREK